jgi:hypothetical protein
MTFQKEYTVVKKIKLHTSPLRTAEVVQTGKFLGETPKTYVFEGFRVHKNNFVRADEIGGEQV